MSDIKDDKTGELGPLGPGLSIEALIIISTIAVLKGIKNKSPSVSNEKRGGTPPLRSPMLLLGSRSLSSNN